MTRDTLASRRSEDVDQSAGFSRNPSPCEGGERCISLVMLRDSGPIHPVPLLSLFARLCRYLRLVRLRKRRYSASSIGKDGRSRYSSAAMCGLPWARRIDAFPRLSSSSDRRRCDALLGDGMRLEKHCTLERGRVTNRTYAVMQKSGAWQESLV